MTSVTLPTTPGVKMVKPRLLDFGGVLVPHGGGAAQRLNRGGSRFSCDFEMPEMFTEANGRLWVSALGRAMSAGATMLFPQTGLVIGSPGSAPKIDGALQVGASVMFKAMTVGYVVREGQFFTIVVGGRGYLHAAAATGTVSGAGKVTLSIWPPLRVSPPDNAVVNFAAPYIEGYLSGTDMPWELPQTPTTKLNFTINEFA